MKFLRYKRIMLIVAFWLAALLASFFIDKSALSAANAIQNPALSYVMKWFSQYASLFFILLVMTSLFLWEGNKKRWIKPLLLSFFAAITITYIIKFIVARARPEGFVQLIWFTNLIDYSFPSAHAASAFAPIAVLDRKFPKLKWFWLGFAIIVSLSRLYFGVHYLSDIIAGAFIGYFSGKLFASLVSRRKNGQKGKS